MKRVPGLLATVTVVSVLCGCLLSAADYAQRADDYLKKEVQSGRFSGSVIVARSNAIALMKGYGLADRERQIPNAPKTKFRLGSLTKQFTAVCILKLQESGKLNIDDPVSRFVTDCPGNWSGITIRHLLTHTSGIQSFTDFPDYKATMMLSSPPEKTIQRFRGKPLEFKPGEGFSYSNSGYILLGYIIEEVSGKSYEEYVREVIFTPLGMRESGYDHPEQTLPNRAAGYSKNGETWAKSAPIDMTVPHAAGALYSTAEDFFRWYQCWRAGKILSDESWKAMKTPGKGNYGFGIGVSGQFRKIAQKVFEHGGGINGFATFMKWFPEADLFIAVFGNADSAPAGEVANNLAALMLNASANTNTPAAPNDDSIFHDTMVRMTWPQVQQAAKANALVLVPVGVIEEHGPHMSLGADTYLACLRCRRIKAALAAAGCKSTIAPPFYWGITDDTSQFPGSFSVRPETMTALITDICQSLHSWGFRRLVFVNDHGNPNHRRTLHDSLAKVRTNLNVSAFSLDTMLTDVPVYQPPERLGRYQPDYHAGAAETGVMAKEFPAEVDIRLAELLKPQPEFKPLGYVGDPARFRQEDALIDYFLRAPEYDARRILAFFGLNTAQPGAGAQQHPGVDVDPGARDSIRSYIQALGGRDKLEAIRTHIRYGALREQENTNALRCTWSAGGKWLMILEPTRESSERFGFNGSFGWHAERGRVEQLPEPLVEAISMALDPRFALGLESRFKKLARPREQRSNERQVKVVEGEMFSGAKVTLTFDVSTGLLWKCNEVTFDDYRETDGVRFPFSITIKPGTEACFERMENNGSVEATHFDPPK